MKEFNDIVHPGVTQQFHEEGYAVIRRVIPESFLKDLMHKIEIEIDTCAKQLECSTESYLTSVSRWVDPSPITACVVPHILKTVSQTLQNHLKKSIHLKKMNVICKNAHNTLPIPYHQDITYSPKDPYEFSTWIAINDVSHDSGTLEVIPGSHLWPLQPAVDFWSPSYQQDPSLKDRAIKLILKAGDVVLFDARLWHGSGNNGNLSARYALVVRWSSEGWQFNQPIPAIVPDFFGLWTSGKVTQDILAKGLKAIFNSSEPDFTKLLDTWIQRLRENPLPFVDNINDTLEALHSLKTLHLAYSLHNGGDAAGTVYKNIWEKLLVPLNNYVSEIETRRYT